MGTSLERTNSNLQVTLALLLLLVFEAVGASEVQAQLGDALANNLKGNVVRIISPRPSGQPVAGFGFVVGERAGLIYIVTADHVVRDQQNPNQTPEAPGIYFFEDQGKEYRGDLLATRRMPGSGDVAVIRLQPPPGFKWRPDVLANVDPARGANVWFIGAGDDWFVPARPGTFSSVEPEKIRFEALAIREGTSGAPLVAETGIVGMVVSAFDVYIADATPNDVIERAFRDWRYPWQLTRASAPLTNFIPRPPASAPPVNVNPAPPASAPLANVIPRPPPSGPTTNGTSSPPAIDKFITRNNRDVWLNDIPLTDGSLGIKNIDLEECARKCINNSRCVGLSYDRWNKACFLKSRIAESILDPKSTIAVKKPAELPNVSKDQATMEPLYNRRVHGELSSSKRLQNRDACYAACRDDVQCVAFNFLKDSSRGDNCELYNMADDHNRDTTVDAGYKHQKPSAASR